MTTHLKPGFCYELQLRLRRAMDVTKLLKLENSRNHEVIGTLISFSG
jgi:hypothetical protein